MHLKGFEPRNGHPVALSLLLLRYNLTKGKESNVHKHTWKLCKYTWIRYCYIEVTSAIVTEIDTSRPPKSNTASGCDSGPVVSTFHPHLLSHYSHPEVISIFNIYICIYVFFSTGFPTKIMCVYETSRKLRFVEISNKNRMQHVQQLHLMG